MSQRCGDLPCDASRGQPSVSPGSPAASPRPPPALLELPGGLLGDDHVHDDGEELHPVQGSDAVQPHVQEGVGVLGVRE